MSVVNKVQHKGKAIFFADHKGSQSDDVLQGQERLLSMIKDAGITDALSLTDMTNVFTTPVVHTRMKEIGSEILKYSKKAAVVGMESKAKNFLISAYMSIAGKPMKLFSTIDEAKEWLVKG